MSVVQPVVDLAGIWRGGVLADWKLLIPLHSKICSRRGGYSLYPPPAETKPVHAPPDKRNGRFLKKKEFETIKAEEWRPYLRGA